MIRNLFLVFIYTQFIPKICVKYVHMELLFLCFLLFSCFIFVLFKSTTAPVIYHPILYTYSFVGVDYTDSNVF